MASSDRRSSMSSIRSAVSRTSASYNRNPLAAGTTLPMPSPPIPPPKDRLPPPMTPQRKPVQRQKSPLSAEAFSSPVSTIPGSFPDTPSPPQGLQSTPYSTEVHSSNTTPESTPGSKGYKRLSSMRNLLPFKMMRRSYESTSPDTSNFRPTTPGEESVTSSGRPSLRKKMSGSFWRRKSSLGTTFVPGQEGEGNGHAERQDDTIMEDSRPATPALEDTPPPLKKRKSSTFWRRKSSLTLADTLNAEKQGWGSKPSESAVNGNGNGHGYGGTSQMERKVSDRLGRKSSEPQSPHSPPPPRSYSPPPQLPEFVGGGEGLGLGEDFFREV